MDSIVAKYHDGMYPFLTNLLRQHNGQRQLVGFCGICLIREYYIHGITFLPCWRCDHERLTEFFASMNCLGFIDKFIDTSFEVSIIYLCRPPPRLPLRIEPDLHFSLLLLPLSLFLLRPLFPLSSLESKE